jgi:tetratricopeptide (TPR) repeat protein
MARSVIRVGLVLLAVCLLAGPALAASDPRTEKAREHYLQGDAFYKLDRYANALGEYEQAYLAKPDPSFLYNIAQCHRLMGDKAEAVKFYRRYLKDAPAAPNREVAEKHIKDLEAALAAPGAAAASPAAPQPAGSGAAMPVVAGGAPIRPVATGAPMPPPGSAAPPATTLALAAPPPSNAPSGGTLAAAPQGSRQDDQQPIYAKWWFWTGVGVVVVGGLLLALSANKSDPSCPAGRTCQ